MFENNVASIENKLRKDRAMAEVQRLERDRGNTAMMQDFRDLREEQRRGQRQTEAGLLSIKSRLLRAINNTREVSQGAVAQPTGSFPRHSQSKRSREANPLGLAPARLQGSRTTNLECECPCRQETLHLLRLGYRWESKR